MIQDRALVAYPWGAPLGLARAAVFGGMGLTLLLNPSWVLFTTSAVQPRAPRCDSYSSWALFCSVGEHLEVARIVAGAVLLIAASGIVPWARALPAAYLVLSTSVTMTLSDGGDQLYGILAVLLVPLSLTDWRRSSWSQHTSLCGPRVRGSIAFVSWIAIRAQVFVVYLEAAFGKLGVPEWANGSALYYWLRNPTFGPGELLAAPVQALTSIPLVTGAATFAVVALEFALAIGPVLSLRLRRLLLVAGFALHGAIIALMGITSFSIVMFAALLLHLPDVDARACELLPRKGDWVVPARTDAA